MAKNKIKTLLTTTLILTAMAGINDFVGNSAYASLILPSSTASQISAAGYEPSEIGFYKAAKDGNLKVLSLFTEASVFVNMKDATRKTPVYVAAAAGQAKAVRFFLLCGADINARDENMTSPLMAAIKAKSYETAQVLIDANANLKVADDNGYTPLHYAVMYNQIGITQLIATHWCDIDAQDNEGNTPLFYAVTKDMAILQTLLNAGADKNGLNGKNRTALHNAVLKNNITNVRLLLDNGVNVNIEDIYGHTPIHYAQKGSQIYNMLLESGARAD